MPCWLGATQAAKITFFRNGVSLGVAFASVRRPPVAPGLAYFPAISLSHGERCEINFGARPMAFPVPGIVPTLSAEIQSGSLEHSL